MFGGGSRPAASNSSSGWDIGSAHGHDAFRAGRFGAGGLLKDRKENLADDRSLTCCVSDVQKVDVAQRVEELLFLYTNIRLRHQRNKTTVGPSSFKSAERLRRWFTWRLFRTAQVLEYIRGDNSKKSRVVPIHRLVLGCFSIEGDGRAGISVATVGVERCSHSQENVIGSFIGLWLS